MEHSRIFSNNISSTIDEIRPLIENVLQMYFSYVSYKFLYKHNINLIIYTCSNQAFH